MGIPRPLFSALLAVAGFAQTGAEVNIWIPRGPEGGVVGRPAIDPRNPGTLYLGASGNLFKTTDAAGHWSGLGFHPLNVLAVDPQDSNTLYGSGTNVVVKSTDGGLTWMESGVGLPCPCYDLTSLVIDPSNSNILYVSYLGTSGDVSGGVFKSTDGGATWSPARSGLPVALGVPVRGLAIDPQNPGTIYAAMALVIRDGGGIFKSTDGGASWNPVNTGLTHTLPDSPPSENLFSATVPAIDPQNPSTLYEVSGFGEIFRTNDGGANWALAGTVPFPGGPPVVTLVALDPQIPGTLYAVHYDGDILKSADGGGSWSVVLPNPSPSDGLQWTWVAVAPGASGAGAVYAGGNGLGVMKSSDGGSTWTPANSGLTATTVDSLAVDPQDSQTLYAGVSRAGLFKSTDGAASWSTSPMLPAGRISGIALDPLHTGTLYASALTNIQKSLDGGATWVQQLSLDPIDNLLLRTDLSIDLQNPSTLYAYTSGCVCVPDVLTTANGAASWTRLFFSPSSPTALATDPRIAGTVYAGVALPTGGPYQNSVVGGVLKSVDGGVTWTGGATNLWPYMMVSNLAVDPAHANVVYAEVAYPDCWCWDDFNSGYYQDANVAHQLGLHRSTDGGTTWEKLDLPPPYPSLLGVDQDGTVYARGLLRSQDGGVTWTALPAIGLPDGRVPAVTGLAFDPRNPNHLFARTADAGVFEITLSP